MAIRKTILAIICIFLCFAIPLGVCTLFQGYIVYGLTKSQIGIVLAIIGIGSAVGSSILLPITYRLYKTTLHKRTARIVDKPKDGGKRPTVETSPTRMPS
jgi:hypothetical protein